jgi:hypothetical protein
VEEKVAAPVKKSENTAVEIRHTDHVAPFYPQEFGTNFADKLRSLGRYSSLADSPLSFFLFCGRSCKETELRTSELEHTSQQCASVQHGAERVTNSHTLCSISTRLLAIYS